MPTINDFGRSALWLIRLAISERVDLSFPQEDINMFQLKRVYEPSSRTDGLRVLVDRLWPRGLTKERAAVKLWLKDVAPSAELRKWFAHDPAKWKEFQTRYRKELREKKESIDLLRQESKDRTVTLLYGARDQEHNEAIVLKKVLEGRKG